MANGGWYGTKEEWDRVEGPLIEIDSILSNFSNEFDLSLTKNHKDVPERSLKWGDRTKRLIQLYLVNEKALTFNLWLCAYEDRGNERYLKKLTPIEEKTIDEFKNELPNLLKNFYEKLNSWSKNSDQFEFATKLETYPRT